MTVLAAALVPGLIGLISFWRRRKPPEASSEFGYDIEMRARDRQNIGSDSDWGSAVDHLAGAGEGIWTAPDDSKTGDGFLNFHAEEAFI
jgi:hypothetical protein